MLDSRGGYNEEFLVVSTFSTLSRYLFAPSVEADLKRGVKKYSALRALEKIGMLAHVWSRDYVQRVRTQDLDRSAQSVLSVRDFIMKVKSGAGLESKL